MKSHVRPTYTVGIDDISAWGQELCFSPEHPTVIQASGEGWEDFKSREKINSNPVNLAMTFVECFDTPVTALERHDHTQETLLPTSEPIIFAVCSSQHPVPTAEDSAFIVIPRGCAMILHRGTWHSPCFGIDSSTAYHWLADSDPRFPSEWIPIEGGSVTSALFAHCTDGGPRRHS